MEVESDGAFTAEETAAATKALECPAREISSLAGIHFFPNVTKLICNNNLLENIDLTMNTALEELNCHANQLTELYLYENTGLKILVCDQNKAHKSRTFQQHQPETSALLYQSNRDVGSHLQ